MVDIMDKIQKLALISFIMLFFGIGLWTFNPVIASILVSTYAVILMGVLFEIKKYYNKNIYLAISIFILALGLLLTYIYALKLNYIQNTNKIVIFIFIGFVALGSLGMAFIRANSWKNDKNLNADT